MRTAELKMGTVSEGFVVTKGHFNEYFARSLGHHWSPKEEPLLWIWTLKLDSSDEHKKLHCIVTVPTATNYIP